MTPITQALMGPIALKRLQRLAKRLGGSLKVLSVDEFDNRRGLSKAPFTSHRLGVNYKGRKIYLGGAPKVYVADVIHEMAHVFACRRAPTHAYEWSFLGWEMAAASAIGLSLCAWKNGSSEYSLGADEVDLVAGNIQWPQGIGMCSFKQITLLRKDRVKVARALGLINERGRPLSVRVRFAAG